MNQMISRYFPTFDYCANRHLSIRTFVVLPHGLQRFRISSSSRTSLHGLPLCASLSNPQVWSDCDLIHILSFAVAKKQGQPIRITAANRMTRCEETVVVSAYSATLSEASIYECKSYKSHQGSSAYLRHDFITQLHFFDKH